MATFISNNCRDFQRVIGAEAREQILKVEGIVPAIESSHVLAYAKKLAPTLDKEKI